jgi:hypothetical protein
MSKVRPAGAPLKTFGGRASGPAPLHDLFKFCVATFKKAAGRRLTTLEAHDIVCKIAEIVVVGGVRRSALISLSDLSDDRMRVAKSGEWWKENVQIRDNYVGLDAAIFKDPRVWEASGHVNGFSDPLAECKNCNTRIRVDKELAKIGITADEKMSETELNTLFDEHRKQIKCPECGKSDFTSVRAFNLLVKSNLGDFTNNGQSPVYLPGEACQGIYLNFKNIVDTTRVKIPFGIAQIGKAFRNEIAPRNFLFRTREFEQADTQERRQRELPLPEDPEREFVLRACPPLMESDYGFPLA